jgi:hypothetical protein
MRIMELAAVGAVATVVLALPAAAKVIDPVISSNDPQPFPKDAENEPALVIDRNPLRRATFLVAGANDYGDQGQLCPTSGCAFTDGVGISGVYWSGDGKNWTDGAYTGMAATGTTAAAGKPIGTLPHYTSTHWTRGDPGIAAGPAISLARPSWRNGTIFYYSTLVASKKSPQRTVWVSTARLKPSSPASKPSWNPPTRASGSEKRWLDKPAIWVDNAQASANFGTAYVCWTTFASKAAEEEGGPPTGPIGFARSTTGGTSWERVSVPKGGGSGRHGCAIRTDSAGRVYVFWTALTLTSQGREWLAKPESGVECRKLFVASIMMTESSDGKLFSSPRPVAEVDEPGYTDHVQRRCTIDGVAGARTNSFPAVDIANASPTGHPPAHQDTIVVAWSAGPAGKIFLRARINGVWLPSRNVTSPSDRAAAFPAVAIEPHGRNVYIVYNGFAQPWQRDLKNARNVEGVVRAAVLGPVTTGAASWGEVRSLAGDARGASNRDLTAEFLGDYSAVVATDTHAYAAWTDAAATLECGVITDNRWALVSGGTPKPIKDVGKQCPPKKTGRQEGFAFGNVTICGVVLSTGEAGSGQITRVTDCKPGG